jgi:hypothetical protein
LWKFIVVSRDKQQGSYLNGKRKAAKAYIEATGSGRKAAKAKKAATGLE